MDEQSVNVESRTSSQDKRWTIMAALLGTNTAFMLFQGIEQEENPRFIREVALAIIAASLPFQGIYFLIYTFLLEHEGKLSQERMDKLHFASAICQIARLDNVKECFSDPSGECCVVVFERDGQTCAGAFCHDYDYCAWEVFIPVQCSDE